MNVVSSAFLLKMGILEKTAIAETRNRAAARLVFFTNAIVREYWQISFLAEGVLWKVGGMVCSVKSRWRLAMIVFGVRWPRRRRERERSISQVYIELVSRILIQ